MCVTQPFVCPNLTLTVRRARERAKCTNFRETPKRAFRNSRTYRLYAAESAALQTPPAPPKLCRAACGVREARGESRHGWRESARATPSGARRHGSAVVSARARGRALMQRMGHRLMVRGGAAAHDMEYEHVDV